MAFPLLFSPFKINKLNYIDGGLGDAIPIHYFHDNKHNILSIMMTSNDNYKEKDFFKMVLSVSQPKEVSTCYVILQKQN